MSVANDTYKGHFHLQHLNANEKISPGTRFFLNLDRIFIFCHILTCLLSGSLLIYVGAKAVISAASCDKIHMMDKQLAMTSTVHIGLTGLNSWLDFIK